MEQQKTNRYARTSAQVEQMRKLYSQIGEPLPADVIIDLYRHLGQALEAADAPIAPQRGRAKRRRDA